MSRPMGMQITQTVVTLAAATSTPLVAKNTFRHYLAIVNIGVNPATLAFDKAAVAGSGFPLNAAASAGLQGGGITFEAGSVPMNGVNAISTAGTTVVVLEGF